MGREKGCAYWFVLSPNTLDYIALRTHLVFIRSVTLLERALVESGRARPSPTRAISLALVFFIRCKTLPPETKKENIRHGRFPGCHQPQY